MEERTLKQKKRGRPSYIHKLLNNALQDFHVADKRVAKGIHLKTIMATALMEERDRIHEEIEAIKSERQKGWQLEKKLRIINRKLDKLQTK